MTYRSVPLALRFLKRDRGRFLVTSGGVAAVVALVLFLLSTFEGAQYGSTSYIASRDTDVWVSLMNSNNLIRSTSYMLETLGEAMDTLPEVAEVAPLLRAIARTEVGERSMGFFVLGIDPKNPVTTPSVVAGSSDLEPGEIILDRAFSVAHGLKLGMAIRVQEKIFRVVGLSEGTNVIVTQFAFTTLEDASELLGFPGVVSFWLVKGATGVGSEALAAAIKAHLPELNPILHEQFVINSRDELRTGVVPILAAITVFAAVVGAVTLTLLLYGGVQERRVDYALLKALGATQGFVRGVVLRQALLVVSVGLLLGGALFVAAAPFLLMFAPQLTFEITGQIVGTVVLMSICLGLAAAILPIQRLSRVYPGEVFRP